MIIANKLREKNIAEYLIYMWQVEDLIRANQLDIDAIQKNIIDSLGLSAEDYAKVVKWYEELIAMMYAENVKDKGHLQINKNVIINLTDLHQALLKSSKYPFYTTAYYKVLPIIVELRSKKEDQGEPELTTCFEALYGVMLLRLQKHELSEKTDEAVQIIANFLSMLADFYDKNKKGELELE